MHPELHQDKDKRLALFNADALGMHEHTSKTDLTANRQFGRFAYFRPFITTTYAPSPPKTSPTHVNLKSDRPTCAVCRSLLRVRPL